MVMVFVMEVVGKNNVGTLLHKKINFHSYYGPLSVTALAVSGLCFIKTKGYMAPCIS